MTRVFVREKQSEIRHRQKRRRLCDQEGRGWSGVAASQGTPVATGTGRSRGLILPCSPQKEQGLAHAMISDSWPQSSENEFL